jgi:uncharacterized protein
MQRFDSSRLADVLDGAALLGAGGGGTVEVGRQLIAVIDVVTKGAGVAVIEAPFSEVPGGGVVAVAADIGASDTFVPHQDVATMRAFQVLASEVCGPDGSFAGVVPGEVGPESTLAAAVVAAHLDLPLFDADGAGRAVPVLPWSLFDAGGVSASPFALADTTSTSAVLRAPGASAIEDLVRPLVGTAAFGDSAGMSLWAMAPGDVVRLGVLGTLSLAERIGVAMRTAREQPAAGASPSLAAATAALGVDGVSGRILAHGRVRAASSSDQGGFTGDTVSIANADGSVVTVVGENENLIVWRDDESSPMMTAPDLACWIDATGHGCTTSELSKGGDGPVALVGVRADHRWSSTTMLELVRPVLRATGYLGPPGVPRRRRLNAVLRPWCPTGYQRTRSSRPACVLPGRGSGARGVADRRVQVAGRRPLSGAACAAGRGQPRRGGVAGARLRGRRRGRHDGDRHAGRADR